MREEDFDSFPSQHHEPVIITRRPGTNDNFKSKIASPKIVETEQLLTSAEKSRLLRTALIEYFESRGAQLKNNAAIEELMRLELPTLQQQLLEKFQVEFDVAFKVTLCNGAYCVRWGTHY